MGFFDPVSRDQEREAIDRVRSGQATHRDREIVERAAKQAGSTGNAAREAQREDAKKANKPRGFFG